jgi:hypothetical protein
VSHANGAGLALPRGNLSPSSAVRLSNATGEGETDNQDFVQFGVKADAGPFALLGYLLKRYGVTGIPRHLAALVKLATKPFKGFAHEPFNSDMSLDWVAS